MTITANIPRAGRQARRGGARRHGLLKACPALLCGVFACTAVALPEPDAAQLAWIGGQIFGNECSSRLACLTSWNEGEDFPSLGIGHFIWYRQDQQGPFAETFPALLAYMQEHGALLPAWLATVKHEQPWPDRAAFNADQGEARLSELRAFLARHMDLQTAFIVSRFDAALAQLLQATPPELREALQARFDAVAYAALPHGLYALIDYINFKGEGTKPEERYQNQGWGLLQVLQGMPDDSARPLQDFVQSARAVLARRVSLAPPERGEQRWLAGWNKRLQTYLPADITSK